MRHIRKGPEPPELAAWTSKANADWRPVYEDLTGADKKAILAALAAEQGYLCGYCGSRVGEREADCHIEHVVSQEECKRTGQKHLLTAYTNMLGSCMGREQADWVPRHCGAFRGTKPVPVSPYDPDCGTYFVFGLNGTIEPAPDPAKHDAALQAIHNLGLDVPKLKAARGAAIDAVLDVLAPQPDADWLGEAARYDRPDARGRLDPFCFAIRQVLRSYA